MRYSIKDRFLNEVPSHINKFKICEILEVYNDDIVIRYEDNTIERVCKNDMKYFSRI